jgi:prepilin-type N-terminal cleavage/methylation domain-containing protein/prepilin-type processing-associated H-X9-DG protein
MKTRRSENTGFTLIELLVVIAIVAILATLGSVAYQKTIRTSQQAACISHLRSLTQAWLLYCNENNGASVFSAPNAENPITTSWGYKLFPYLEDKTGKVFSCPSASIPPGSANLPGSAVGFYNLWLGSAVGNKPAGYGFNAYWYSDPQSFGATPAVADDKYYQRLLRAKAGEGPVFSDATWVEFRRDAAVPTNFLNPGTYTCAIARHGKGVNMSFFDGSVRLVTMGQLFSEIKLYPTEIIAPSWINAVPARYR